MYKAVTSFLCLTLLMIGIVFLFNMYATDPHKETETITHPTVEEVLTEHPDADLFVYNDIVYIKAEDIEWVNELELQPKTEEEFIIKDQTKSIHKLTDKTATKLPVGTHIYEPLEQYVPVYIAVVNGKGMRYLGLVEG